MTAGIEKLMAASKGGSGRMRRSSVHASQRPPLPLLCCVPSVADLDAARARQMRVWMQQLLTRLDALKTAERRLSGPPAVARPFPAPPPMAAVVAEAPPLMQMPLPPATAPIFPQRFASVSDDPMPTAPL